MRLALLSYNISKHEPLAAFWWLTICHTVHIPNARFDPLGVWRRSKMFWKEELAAKPLVPSPKAASRALAP